MCSSLKLPLMTKLVQLTSVYEPSGQTVRRSTPVSVLQTPPKLPMPRMVSLYWKNSLRMPFQQTLCVYIHFVLPESSRVPTLATLVSRNILMKSVKTFLKSYVPFHSLIFLVSPLRARKREQFSKKEKTQEGETFCWYRDALLLKNVESKCVGYATEFHTFTHFKPGFH